MRRKMLVFLSVIALLVLSSSLVFAGSLNNGPESPQKEDDLKPIAYLDAAANIEARYIAWCGAFGISDLDEEISSSNLNSEDVAMSIDDISVVYSPKTFKTKSVNFFYWDGKGEKSRQIMRFMAFIAATEYDAPPEWNDTYSGIAVEYASDYYKTMCEAYDDHIDELKKGQMIQFKKSGKKTYYITIDSTTGILIYVR